MLIDSNTEITDFRDVPGGKISSLICITWCWKQVKILSNLKDFFNNLHDMCNKSPNKQLHCWWSTPAIFFLGQEEGGELQPLLSRQVTNLWNEMISIKEAEDKSVKDRALLSRKSNKFSSFSNGQIFCLLKQCLTSHFDGKKLIMVFPKKCQKLTH